MLHNVSSRIRKRLGSRLREAFTFLVATAWTQLFDDLFLTITGDDTHLGVRLLHAVLFTLVAVAVTIIFEDDHDD